jgi:hypothetical protein
MSYLSLIRSHQCLSGLICSYPAESPYPILLLIGLLLTRSYTVLLDRITLPDTLLIGLLPTRLYPATLPDFLTRSFLDRTSAYPIVPDHLARLPYPAGLPSDAHSIKLSSTV